MDKSDLNPIFKARYLNNGDASIQENIKKIKVLNKSKLNERHKNFNKKYKAEFLKENKMGVTGFEFYTNIGGLSGLKKIQPMANSTAKSNFYPNNTFFSNKGNNTASKLEWNMMTTRTLTDQQSYYPVLNTQQSSSRQRLTTEMLSAQSPRSTFLRTHNSNFSFNSQMQNQTNNTHQLNLTEEDIDYLISFYHMNENQKGDNTLKKKYVAKETKKYYYDKINIQKHNTEAEKELINNYLSRGDKKPNHFEREMEKFNKTEFLSEPYFFKNPSQSLKKLKINSQIFQNLMNQRTIQQLELYKKLFKEEVEKKMRLSQMPKIRETKANKTITDRLMKTVGGEKASIPRKKTFGDFYHEETEIDFLQEERKKKSEAVATKQMSREQLLEDIEFYVTAENPLHKPNARTQFTLTLENGMLYLFGGLNSERLYDMWMCNINEGFKWKLLDQDEDDAPVPRAGHTAVIYRKDIYFYGGSTPREYFKPREDMLIFSTVTQRFYSERPLNRMEAGWRRNHIAIGVGQTMLVHGGVDENDKFSSDCLVFDFAKFMWTKLDFKGNKPPALAYHCAELVFETDFITHPGFNIYKSPDIPLNKNFVRRIKYEGIYLFGGMDENRHYTNDLRILKIGRRPTEWVYPKVSGTPPKGRVNATMNYYNDLNILIIHGGRNDKEKYSIFSDIFVFDLENLTWIKTSFQRDRLSDRTEHCSVVNGDQLIILGGINARTFNPFDISIVYLDLYNKRKDSKFDRRHGHLTSKKESPQHHHGKPDNNVLMINSERLQDILKLTSDKGNTLTEHFN